ncbi:MAG: Lrp/AsnC family transcriptional regulator [Candidatus Bathyarchaeota archaeon]|nr:Lrp/AsnC family transcriptional regulator [Candidatus Bathyarchaeota archaeon]
MSSSIDLIDAAILKELLIDGRQSFTQIAIKNGTTKEVIANRYKKLNKNGVIVGSTVQTSPVCSGNQFVADFFTVTNFQNLNQLMNLASKIPNVIAAIPIRIKRTIIVIAALKDMQQLEAVRGQLKKLPLVEDIDVRIIMGVRTMPHNLSVLSAIKAPEVKFRRTAETDIDELDTRIVNKLLVDCRVPFYKIAKEFGVSTDTITRRYQRLKRNWLIKPIIQINATKIGYFAFATFNLSVSEKNMQEAIDLVTHIENVNLLEKTSGKFDLYFTLMIKDIEQFTTVQEKIVNLPGLTNLEVYVMKMFEIWPPVGELISNF